MHSIFRIAICLTGLSMIACGGGSGADENDASNDDSSLFIPTSEARPYRDDGPYAPILSQCALARYDDPCTVGILPYIGQSNSTPTVDDILNRTVVTHPWMGERLGEVLRSSPADLRLLFRSVTSVVIGSEVRPSSFRPGIGTIRIDPDFLWLSVAEKRTVSPQEDYRSNYGADLQFVSLWRMTKGDERAFEYFDLTDDSQRQLSDIIAGTARVLYHELAHANDVVPASSLSSLSDDTTPFDLYLSDKPTVAERLLAHPELGIERSWLYPLARIRYADDKPDDYEYLVSLKSDFVGGEMGKEGISRFYGYSTIQEDVATLFDSVMMKYHFGIDTHVGIMDKPANYPDAFCDDYKVGWGMRNRIAAPLVVPRARWVTEQLFGSLTPELEQFFATTIGQSTMLREGDGWCSSRFSNPVVAGARSRDAVSGQEQLRREQALFRDH